MSVSFGATSTTDEVLAGQSLRGKRVLVTGASSGLGVETVRALVAHGALVVGTVRNLEKAKAATAVVTDAAAKSGGALELVALDLGSLASVRACSVDLLAKGKPFDAVIANAGVMATPFGHTADGFETQFGTNHLGHFVLINRIVSILHAGSRVITLSSTAHRQANVDLGDLNFERRSYDPNVAYGQSKTAAALFAVEFDRRHKDSGIRAATVHPGMIYTGLGRHVGVEMLQGWIAGINAHRTATGQPSFEPKTVAQGAATSVWAAFVAPADEVGGKYCEDCHVSTKVFEGSEDDGVSEGYRAYVLDAENAAALWRKSEELVAESY